MKPRLGSMARPTHSNDAPQFAFHRFSLRYELAMISMGTAVTMMIGMLAYAAAAASAARVRPADAPGAVEAIPMTVSCATLMASGSRRASIALGPAPPSTAVTGRSVICSPVLGGRGQPEAAP